MPGAKQIDWEDLLEGYNRIFKTNYRTVKTFLAKVYKANPSIHKVGKILGVSHTTVLDKMQELDIPLLRRGHRGKSKFQERYRAIENVETLKPTEIAKIIGCSVTYVYALVKTVKRLDETNVN